MLGFSFFFFGCAGSSLSLRLFSSCGEWASHCGGFSCCRARALGSLGSVVVGHRLSFPTAWGVFPDQGLNPCLLHWQVDSLPLSHQGSPLVMFWNTWVPVRRAPLTGRASPHHCLLVSQDLLECPHSVCCVIAITVHWRKGHIPFSFTDTSCDASGPSVSMGPRPCCLSQSLCLWLSVLLQLLAWTDTPALVLPAAGLPTPWQEAAWGAPRGSPIWHWPQYES